MSDSNSIAASRHAGQLVHNKGIFVGRCTGMFADKWEQFPVDKWESFNLFAAPHDVGFNAQGFGQRLHKHFREMVGQVADIRGLMGHDGAYFEDEQCIVAALEEGTYEGQWFMPSIEMIKMLLPLKDSGSLRDTFTKSTGSRDSLWSCSQPTVRPQDVFDEGRYRFAVSPVSGEMCIAPTGSLLGAALACRPMRIEPHYKLSGCF